MIKRDGKPIGRSEKEIQASRADAEPEYITVPIADLVPYETCVIRPTVDEKKEEISKGISEPPTVVVIDGKTMVLDGNNRVRAFSELGKTEVLCRVRTVDVQRKRELANDLANRIAGGVSFDNLKVVNSDEERKAHTQDELAAEDSALWTKELMRLASATTVDGEDH